MPFWGTPPDRYLGAEGVISQSEFATFGTPFRILGAEGFVSIPEFAAFGTPF